VGDKVVWLAGRQGQLADFSLNPPQMGALEVRLTVSGGEATAQFFSPNPVVRDALDAAMPKLRELMAEAGLSLGEAEVRDQAFSRRDGTQLQAQARSHDAEIVVHPGALAGIGMARSGGLGLVDLYI
jgi:flagellar hook-length control protein FliK